MAVTGEPETRASGGSAERAATPQQRFDELVASSPQGSVFATAWWLDSVAPGRWRPNLVDADGRTAAWPTVVRETRFGAVHVGAPLTPFLGPLFPADSSRQRRSRELAYVERLLEQLTPFAHLEARCHPAFDYWAPLLWHGFSQTTHYTWRLPDLTDLEAVWTGLRENVRREIRKAQKAEVEASEGSLGEFLDLHARAAERRPVLAHRELLERVHAAASARDAGTILVARDPDGRPHSAGFFVHDSRFTYYLLGASAPALRTSGAASLVMWEAIRRAAERGRAFDFEGSMLRHVERFVRAFGGVPTPYSLVRSTPSALYRATLAVKRPLARRLGRR